MAGFIDSLVSPFPTAGAIRNKFRKTLWTSDLTLNKLDNLGTYFGTVYEPVYTAGIAAGAASESGKLGYVYAFPIPQTLANINAFTLGAQSVNPDIETIAVSTGSWCDPGVQAEAAQSLLDQGVDVITQHQDCTKTIIEAAEAAGAYSVGYHADASSLAPRPKTNAHAAISLVRRGSTSKRSPTIP